MSRFELSRVATKDIREIRRYTRKHFGPAQVAKLRERFQEVFEGLAASPAIGQQRAEYDPPEKEFRYHPVLRSFVVVYEPVEDGVRVARVLHGARDLAAALELDSGAP